MKTKSLKWTWIGPNTARDDEVEREKLEYKWKEKKQCEAKCTQFICIFKFSVHSWNDGLCFWSQPKRECIFSCHFWIVADAHSTEMQEHVCFNAGGHSIGPKKDFSSFLSFEITISVEHWCALVYSMYRICFIWRKLVDVVVPRQSVSLFWHRNRQCNQKMKEKKKQNPQQHHVSRTRMY